MASSTINTIIYIVIIPGALLCKADTGDAPIGIAIATDRRKKALEKVDTRHRRHIIVANGAASAAARRVHLSLA